MKPARLSTDLMRTKLSFESLEDRRMLATWIVTNQGDLDQDGNTISGTLRWAIEHSNAMDDRDTIVFADTLSTQGATIRLNGGTLTITQPVDILGPGPRQITVANAKSNNRVFELNIGSDDEIFPVQISGITISNGNRHGTDERGGGVLNREALTMIEVIVEGNSADGGGGIATIRGSLRMERSVVQNNSATKALGGGGILNGTDSDENRPTTTINNSTIRANDAAMGGGVFNRNGILNINSCTISENSAPADMGGGVGSWGNPLPDDPMDDPPPPTVFTYFYSSIIFGNMETDVDRVGKDDEDNDLLPSIFMPTDMGPMPGTTGYNIVGTGNAADSGSPDFAFMSTGDQVGADPLLTDFDDYGGSTDSYLLDVGSPAIDKGDPSVMADPMLYDQRGRHFRRVAIDPNNPAGMEVMDVGAVEMQNGVFIVDTILDELDGCYTRVFAIDSTSGFAQITVNRRPYDTLPGTLFQVFGLTTRLYGGRFSLREALDFATKNPGLDTIQFAEDFNLPDYLKVEDINDTVVPTIYLKLGSLGINQDLILQGPSTYILEVDASGSDANPNQPTGGGTRVFQIDDFDPTVQSKVDISNLTIMGADFAGPGAGGGMFTREDLTLANMTFKNNNSTSDGGALYVQGATVTIDNSTFNNNRAAHDGGAIFAAAGATLNITNSTLSGNTAGNRGAGISNSSSHVTLNFSTLTLNNATSTQGSGVNNTGATSLTEVGGTIISGNVNNDISFSSGATVTSFKSLGYNFIGKGTGLPSFGAATNDITNNTNPMLEPLLNTGGLVETHRPVYRPADGLISPVIDAGDPMAMAGAGGVPLLDQRNLQSFTRVFDVPGVGAAGARIDIGSYELQGAVFTVDSPSDDNDGDYSMGNFTLREAIALANQNPLFDTVTFDTMSIGPTIFLGTGILTVGTPLDLRITSPMTITLSDDDLMNGVALAIDGSSLLNVPQSGNTQYSRMFTINDGSSATRIDVTFRGLTFQNGTEDAAGGVMWSSENLTLDQNTFVNNQTLDEIETPAINLTGLHGGAVYQQGVNGFPLPTLTVTNSIFTGNSTNDADADGGAIYALYSNVAISDSIISGNSTKQGSSEGGAIVVKNSVFTSNFNTFTGNITSFGASDGGAIYSDNSFVTLDSDVLSGNATNGSNSRGGGLSALNSTVTLNDTVISNNQTNGVGSSGGGLYTRLDTVVLPTAVSVLTLNRSLVTQNTTVGASSLGAGVSFNGGTVKLNASTVSENKSNGAGSHGAGVAALNGNLIVRDSTINNNLAADAQSRGGGVYSDTNLAGTQSTQIINSTISGNVAKLRGGGVYNADGLVEIKHSTITNNDVLATIPPNSVIGDFDGDNDVDGADLLIWQRNLGRLGASQSQGDANHDGVVNGADLTLVRINFGTAAGSTPNAGSGVASLGNASTQTRILSSIVAANRGAGTGTDVDAVDGGVNSFQSQGYNVVGNGNAAAAFAAVGDLKNVLDPRLAPLADNGADPANTFGLQTHALLADSPAINHGSPTFNPNSFAPPLTTDERGVGFARVQAGRIDAGAFESSFFPVVVTASAALLAEEPAADESGELVLAPSAPASATSVPQPTAAASVTASVVSLGSPMSKLSAGGDSQIEESALHEADRLPWDAALALLGAGSGRSVDYRSTARDEWASLVDGSQDSGAALAEDDVFAQLGADLLA
jgi:predicted outer membrane repeat protein